MRHSLSESFTGLGDEIVLYSVGAKAKNYDILDFSTNERNHSGKSCKGAL